MLREDHKELFLNKSIRDRVLGIWFLFTDLFSNGFKIETLYEDSFRDSLFDIILCGVAENKKVTIRYYLSYYIKDIVTKIEKGTENEKDIHPTEKTEVQTKQEENNQEDQSEDVYQIDQSLILDIPPEEFPAIEYDWDYIERLGVVDMERPK